MDQSSYWIGSPCVVCGDASTGRHYGAVCCEGCKAFFKRSIRNQIEYSCVGSKQCPVTKYDRNRCQYCRLVKCLQMGMNCERVPYERRPCFLLMSDINNEESVEAALGGSEVSSQESTAIGPCPQPRIGPMYYHPFLSNNQGPNKLVEAALGSQSPPPHNGGPWGVGSVSINNPIASDNHQGTNWVEEEAALAAAEPSPDNGTWNEEPISISYLLSNNEGVDQDEAEANLGSELSPGSIGFTWSSIANTIIEARFNTTSDNVGGNTTLQDEAQKANASDSSTDAAAITKAIEIMTSVINQTKEKPKVEEVPLFVEKSDLERIIPEELTNSSLVLSTINPIVGLPNLQYVCETASRLLILSLDWARSLPVFSKFGFESQTAIAKAGWTDLITIGLVQVQNLFPFVIVVSANLMHLQEAGVDSSKIIAIADYVSRLDQVIKAVQMMNLSDMEYSALKAMALFSSDRFFSLDRSSVSAAQEIHKSVLNQLKTHLKEVRKVDWSERFASLLLVLPQLRSIDSSVIEQLFFVNVLGSKYSVDNVIPSILQVGLEEPLREMYGDAMEAVVCEYSNNEDV